MFGQGRSRGLTGLSLTPTSSIRSKNTNSCISSLPGAPIALLYFWTHRALKPARQYPRSSAGWHSSRKQKHSSHCCCDGGVSLLRSCQTACGAFLSSSCTEHSDALSLLLACGAKSSTRHSMADYFS